MVKTYANEFINSQADALRKSMGIYYPGETITTDIPGVNYLVEGERPPMKDFFPLSEPDSKGAFYGSGLFYATEVFGPELLGLGASKLFNGLRNTRNISTPSGLAREYQGSDPYFGTDNYRDITLKKGSFITSGVHSPDLDDLTGFFTTQSGLNRSLSDGFVDANKFNQGLQIYSARPEYRPGVTIFEVLEDTPAAFGLTKANPRFNPGGYKSLPQIYVPDYESVLKPVISIPAINKKAPVYD
jgi:hypothetical protein